MSFSDRDAFRELLLDPAFWRPRLEKLEQVPRDLRVFPRPDLARPGIEVVELRLRACDGARLRCILGRPSFYGTGATVHVRVTEELRSTELDWQAIEEGGSDIVLSFPPGRRLEDRVLDVLRVAQAAGSVESTDWHGVRLLPCQDGPKDELVLADLVRAKGWV